MNCTQCRETLGMGHRENASPDERSALHAHLTQCPACAREAAQLEQLFILLDRQEHPSSALAAGFAARLGQWENNNAKSAPVHTMPTISLGALFRALWPTRPLGAFSYSTALLFTGLLGGQLLPPGLLGVNGPEAAQESKTTNGTLICPVQYSPSEDFHSPAKLLS